jgi:hypothetical protein
MRVRFKMLAWSIAGCCLLASGASYALAEANASGAFGTALVPISAQLPQAGGVKVTTKMIKETSDLITVDASLPVIGGMKDTRYQRELNAAIERRTMQDLDSLKQQAAKDAEEAKKSGYEYRPHSLTVKYELKSDGSAESGDRLSLVVDSYIFTGGAHGMPRLDAYNVWNREKAEPIKLQDLFGSDYKKIIDKQIENEISRNPDMYFEDAFKGISDRQTFYVEDGNAVIVFQPYEIAPYAAGMPKFPIAIPGQTGSSDTGLQPPAEGAAAELMVQGKVIPSDEGVIYTNADGTVMVPLRTVAEHLGFKVVWNPDTEGAEVSRGAQWTAVQPGSDSYTFNKMAPISLGAAPVIREDGKMYVPQSFFSDILKADVQWNGNAMRISIS